MSISEPFRYRNDSFQSDIFSSDMGITDVRMSDIADIEVDVYAHLWLITPFLGNLEIRVQTLLTQINTYLSSFTIPQFY